MPALTTPKPTLLQLRATVGRFPAGSAAEADLFAYGTAVDRHLLRKREEHAAYADILYLYELGETPEGAAEYIEGQRWLARTAREAA